MQERLNQEDAEQIARAILSQLAESQATLGSPTKDITIDDFGDLFMTTYAKPHKKTWKDDLGRLNNHIIPAFAGRMLRDITRADIIDLHSKMKETPYAANRVVEQLGCMFRQAQLLGYFPEERRVPTSGIRAYKEYRREEFIPLEKMEKLSQSIDRIRVQKYKILFWLYLLTGLRRSELLFAKWSWLDTARLEFTVPAKSAKNGKRHVVPLSLEAAALFASLPRGPGDAYIFPGGNPGKPLNKSTVWHAWDRVRRRAQLTDICIHGLRHTFASHLAQSGCSLALLGKLLNQSSARTTEIYAHFAINNQRDVLQQHSSVLSRYIKK